ncbi:hypothetical protein [Paraprevotella xylaniphila]|uniref:hypothetical protein n=1 Tax=Paraprevotella xylaniphila TaxID=454155 RepID=UPI003AB2A12C
MKNGYNTDLKGFKTESGYCPIHKKIDQELTKENHRHEQATLTARYSHQYKVQEISQNHELNIINKKLGLIGQIIGNSENASKNITCIICILLLGGATIISLVIYWGKDDVSFVQAIWNNIMPVITLSLGYLFGKK